MRAIYTSLTAAVGATLLSATLCTGAAAAAWLQGAETERTTLAVEPTKHTQPHGTKLHQNRDFPWTSTSS